MNQRKSQRKEGPAGRPNLRLVPKPKSRRRRWKLPTNLRRIRKPKYENNVALLLHEEQVVLREIMARDGATLRELMQDEGRWNRRELWRTIQRLRRKHEITGWLSYAKTPPILENERYRPR